MTSEERARAWFESWHLRPSAELVAEFEAVAREAREQMRERCIEIVESQAHYPDTVTGMRQQWVKDQIVGRIRALPVGAGEPEQP